MSVEIIKIMDNKNSISKTTILAIAVLTISLIGCSIFLISKMKANNKSNNQGVENSMNNEVVLTSEIKNEISSQVDSSMANYLDHFVTSDNIGEMIPYEVKEAIAQEVLDMTLEKLNTNPKTDSFTQEEKDEISKMISDALKDGKNTITLGSANLSNDLKKDINSEITNVINKAIKNVNNSETADEAYIASLEQQNAALITNINAMRAELTTMNNRIESLSSGVETAKKTASDAKSDSKSGVSSDDLNNLKKNLESQISSKSGTISAATKQEIINAATTNVKKWVEENYPKE